MKILFAIVLALVLVLEAIECRGFEGIFSGPIFGGPPFGNGFGHGGRGPPHGDRHHHHGRHNDYSIPAIIKKVEQMEGYFDRYLDRAIGVAKTRNSSHVEVLEELRNTDVPQFFNSVIQKLNATQSSNSTNTVSITGTVGSNDTTGPIVLSTSTPTNISLIVDL